jgi:hypothetical protein
MRVNPKLLLGATLAIPLLLLQTSRTQTVPGLSDAKAALPAAKEREPEVSSVVPNSPREGPSATAKTSVAYRFQKVQFFALSTGVYAAAAADMHQTLQMRHYSWWSETDPLARPFVHLPAPAYYATGFALATGVNWLAWKMGRSRKWHKLAPWPQLFAIGGNTYGFKSNHYQGY